MLTGSEVLALLLDRPRVHLAPGSPLGRLERRLRGDAAARPQRALSDAVALGLGLGGALLPQEPACVLLGPEGLCGALGPLRGLGLLGDYRAGAVLLDGSEADPRAALRSAAPLPLLEAATADELHPLAVLAFALSEATGAPVALRTPLRALRDRADVRPGAAPPAPEPTRAFSREEAPYLLGGPVAAYHGARRAALFARLEPVLAPLLVRTPGSGRRGVVLAGHLGRRAQARAAGRGLATLRLGVALPLPEAALREFLGALTEVLVLEEGEPYLLGELQALTHRAGLAVRVRGPETLGLRRPLRLDEAQLEAELAHFAGPARGDGPAPPYDLGRARALPPLRPQLDTRGELSEEPWPLYLARVRRDLAQLVPGQGPLRLLTLLQGLGRLALVCTAPGPAFAPGFHRALCDVQPPLGCVAAVAGALSQAASVEGAPGRPLAVALLGDETEAAAEHAGLLDNALAGRDVLHVLLRPPTEDPLSAQLRAAGLELLQVDLDDEDLLRRALDYLSHRRGPRALVCVGEELAASQLST